MITKANLRKTILSNLRQMSPSECFEKSMQAWKALYSTTAWQDADTVLGYSAMADELESESMLLYTLKSGKLLCLPRIEGANVVFYEVATLDQLETTRSGFSQPIKNSNKFNLSQFKTPVIIAPALGANQSGFRLGRGAGYYDRFLGGLYRHSGSVITIVATYSDNITDDFIQEAHDQPFNYILSDKGIQKALS